MQELNPEAKKTLQGAVNAAQPAGKNLILC